MWELLYLSRGIIHNILTIVHKIASYKRWKYIKDNMIIFIDSLIDTEWPIFLARSRYVIYTRWYDKDYGTPCEKIGIILNLKYKIEKQDRKKYLYKSKERFQL